MRGLCSFSCPDVTLQEPLLSQLSSQITREPAVTAVWGPVGGAGVLCLGCCYSEVEVCPLVWASLVLSRNNGGLWLTNKKQICTSTPYREATSLFFFLSLKHWVIPELMVKNCGTLEQAKYPGSSGSMEGRNSSGLP